MSDEQQEVWSATVDNGTYKVTVIRNAERSADLTVIHVASGMEILTQQVGLSYGAIFGPDVDDVAAWQDLSLEAIDAWALEQDSP